MTTRAIDLVSRSPWAITPEALEQIAAIAERTNASPEAVAAQLGRPLDNTRTVTQRDTSAIVPVAGPIFRRANLLTEISGATSVEVLAADLERAAADPAIDRIILEIDSPGGEATGIAELAAQIRAIDTDRKPVIAYVDGMAASAAYWLASAAREIVAAPTAMLGSIGVVATYRKDKDTETRIISSVSPLKHATPDTEAGRTEAQRLVDQLADIFVADVARYRDTTPEAVAADFGRGGVLIGASAVAANMADRVAGFESLFPPAGNAGPNALRGNRMTYQQQVNAALGLPADASADDAVQAVTDTANQLAAADTQAQERANQASAEATEAERARVSAILAAAADAPHARAVADTAIARGMSAADAEALIAATPAPGADVAAARQQHQAESQSPADTADASEPAAKDADFESLVQQQISAGASRGQAIRAVASQNPKAHRAYLARVQQNR